MEKNKPLVILAGPTASGKTALSVRLCGEFSGSVISADSMQVYHDMPIGSARIRKEEMGNIPHYLIDLISPKEVWNVVRFQEEARKAYTDIRTKERLPFLVGGTGFYIQSFLYDIDFTQMKDRGDYRADLEQLAAAGQGEKLYKMLCQQDPEAASSIHPNNLKRIIRALEFSHESGLKISEHNDAQRQKPPAYDQLYFVLTMEREALYRRIDDRVDQMLRDGLVEEVRCLKQSGLTEQDVSMQGLGYRQLFPYLEGKITLEEAVAMIKVQTRHFAKRQLTWFRREEKRSSIVWVDRSCFNNEEALYAFMKDKIREKYHL